VATSVELLQSRLLRSTIPCIDGAQFDVAQSKAILENVFKTAIARKDVPIRLGPNLLQSLIDRQQDQVAGVQAFINSIKVDMHLHVAYSLS
jgi:origin recognition complex subunit 3